MFVPFFGFVIGILAAGFYTFPSKIIWTLFVCISVLSVLLIVFPSTQHWLVFVVQFGLLGLTITALQNQRLGDNHYTNSAPQSGYYKAEIAEQPRPTNRAIRLTLRLAEVSKISKTISGNVFLYVPKKWETLDMKTGDVILFKTHFQTIEPPKNPNEFDYQNYMHLHQVYWQGYTAAFKLLSRDDSSIQSKVDELRSTLLGIIESLDLSDEEKAVSSALLLGYRYNLSNDTEQAFAGAGAMHVLAVSGLHVGILYMITAFLLKLDKRKRHRNHWSKVAMVLIIIWSYAFLTGLSPSVNRAALMFTFVSLGALIKRQPSAYQAILSSAFVLLIYNPNNLFEVGFQLSYAAVFGILYIQPKLYYLLPAKGKWYDKIWAITTVSIAAQVATFPFGLYYFHQFPVLFLVSNLIVIPAAYVLMCYGLVMLTVSLIIPLSGVLIVPYKWILWLMINSVHMVESVPYAVIKGISISRLELILFVILAFALISALFEKRKRSVFLFMFCSLFLLSSFVWHWRSAHQEKSITFYSIKRQTAFSVRHGKTGILLADENLMNDESKMRFHINHHLWASGARYNRFPLSAEVDSTSITQSNGCTDVMGQRILLLTNPKDTIKISLNPDFIFVTGTVFPPKDIPQTVNVILQNGLTESARMAWLNLPKCSDLSDGFARFKIEE